MVEGERVFGLCHLDVELVVDELFLCVWARKCEPSVTLISLTRAWRQGLTIGCKRVDGVLLRTASGGGSAGPVLRTIVNVKSRWIARTHFEPSCHVQLSQGLPLQLRV